MNCIFSITWCLPSSCELWSSKKKCTLLCQHLLTHPFSLLISTQTVTLRNTLPRRLYFRIRTEPPLGGGLCAFPLGGTIEAGESKTITVESDREALPYGTGNAPIKGCFIAELSERFWSADRQPLALRLNLVLQPKSYY